jgi:tetratricopeptide (TPR) repeat protein
VETSEQTGEPAYAAFLSYNHRDAAWARRLHRRLENYKLPGGLRQDARAARLRPIFRDQDELPAATDLSAAVKQALGRSKALVVLCSPNAAASTWVDMEVRLFRQLHPDRPILAALIEGEPGDSFPPALREGPELLAADLRSDGPGVRLGFLKLVAGLSAVGLDQLVQRDAQQRMRRVMAVTAIVAIIAALFATLSVLAWRAQVEAERQRSEAEGLIEFMLTDLRQRLRSVGRLDALTATNERAMTYYEDQGDLSALPVISLERRARILHAMGEDDVARGDLKRAYDTFQEAYRTTAALLEKEPDDPDRIFTHAQSEFWIGHVDQLEGRFDRALAHYEAYLRWSRRLENVEPRNARSALEMGYALSNIAILRSDEQKDYAGALKLFDRSLYWFEHALKIDPTSQAAREEIAERHAWIADMYFYLRDYPDARRHRARQLELLAAMQEKDPKNGDLAYQTLVANRALAKINAKSGDLEEAARLLDEAQAQAASLRARDPENQTWFEQELLVVVEAGENARRRQRPADVRRIVEVAQRLLQQTPSTAASDPEFREDSLRRLQALKENNP